MALSGSLLFACTSLLLKKADPTLSSRSRIVSIEPDDLVGIVGEHEDFPVERMRLSHDKKYLASSSHDNSIKFWNVTYLYDDDEDEEGNENGDAEEEDADEMGEQAEEDAEEGMEVDVSEQTPSKNKGKGRALDQDEENDEEDDEEDGEDGQSAPKKKKQKRAKGKKGFYSGLS